MWKLESSVKFVRVRVCIIYFRISVAGSVREDSAKYLYFFMFASLWEGSVKYLYDSVVVSPQEFAEQMKPCNLTYYLLRIIN